MTWACVKWELSFLRVKWATLAKRVCKKIQELFPVDAESFQVQAKATEITRCASGSARWRHNSPASVASRSTHLSPWTQLPLSFKEKDRAFIFHSRKGPKSITHGCSVTAVQTTTTKRHSPTLDTFYIVGCWRFLCSRTNNLQWQVHRGPGTRATVWCLCSEQLFAEARGSHGNPAICDRATGQ